MTVRCVGKGAPRRVVERRTLIVFAIAAVAFFVRALPYVFSGQIAAVREYDDGVMLGGAIAMFEGLAPYADFFYLHPPGSLVMLVPVAATASLWGEPGAMAFGRVAAILLGVANTALIAVLLQRRGAFAMIVGAGLYALWPVVVSTERTILLEPVLVFGLLLSLLFLRGRTGAGTVVAGICLGAVTAVKVWAIVDVAILAVIVGLTMGRLMLVRFVAAAAAAITAVCLPFFLISPAAMWEQVVVAQVARAGTPASVPTRLSTMSLSQGVHAIDLRVPWQVWLILFVGLLLLSVLPLVEDVRRRTPFARWAEASWWATLTLAHVFVIMLAAGFFYHYAVWLLAPLCLSVGYAAGGLAWRSAKILVAAGLAAVLAMTTLGAARHPGEPLERAGDLASWAGMRQCIWADTSRLIAADALRSNLRNACPMDIDGFGAFLVLDTDVARETDQFASSAVWRERQWDFLTHADGAILPGDEVPTWFTPAQRAEFAQLFDERTLLEEDGLWSRTSR